MKLSLLIYLCLGLGLLGFLGNLLWVVWEVRFVRRLVVDIDIYLCGNLQEYSIHLLQHIYSPSYTP